MHGTKWMKAVVGSLACALAVSACISGCTTVPTTAGAPDPGLRGQWVLASGHDGYGVMNLLGQVMTLTITDEPVSIGRSSCSDYTATIYGAQTELWITTATPQSFSCTTADQSVLQLEYLTDLRGVSRSTVSATSLELAGRDVDLRFTRATTRSLANLVDKIWQLKSAKNLSLHGAATLNSETGGYLRFDSKTTLTGVTRCVTFNANYEQNANELVASNVLAVQSLSCDQSTDQAARDLTRLFDGGFTFALTPNSLALTSSRAGLTLGFNELETP